MSQLARCRPPPANPSPAHASFVPVISHRLYSMENLLLRRGDSSISLGQRRPAHCNAAVQRAQLGTLTRALFCRSCAPPGAVPQKNSLTIKSNSRAALVHARGSSRQRRGSEAKECFMFMNMQQATRHEVFRRKEIVVLKPCRRCRRDMSLPWRSMHAEGLKKENKAWPRLK